MNEKANIDKDDPQRSGQSDAEEDNEESSGYQDCEDEEEIGNAP